MKREINSSTRESLTKVLNKRNEDMEIKIREMRACMQLQQQAMENAVEIASHVEKLFSALHLNLSGADTCVSLNSVNNSHQSYAILRYDIDTAEDFKYIKYESGYDRASAKADRMARRLEKVIPEKFEASVYVNPFSIMENRQRTGEQVIIEIQFEITRK